jgi:drug/metabolite transporter (DMT)-like permease
VPAAQLQLLAMVELALSPLWVWLIVAEVPPQATLLGGGLILGATILQAVAGSLRPMRTSRMRTM